MAIMAQCSTMNLMEMGRGHYEVVSTAITATLEDSMTSEMFYLCSYQSGS